MKIIELALRALDPGTFEALITSLLKVRYPTIDIKHVNGQGGDQGLDVITGNLDDSPTIWQCKSFPDGIKASQKQQIKDSLNTALKHYKPRRWVLCISTDLDAKSLLWWQRLVKSNANRTELQIWTATDIVQQLLYQDAVREHFFPQLTVSAPVIRETLAGTNVLSIEDLATLNQQNASSYLARLERMDSRFSYAITHGRNHTPNVTPYPNTLLSVTNSHATVHVTPRDYEALALKPPEVHFTVRGAGVDKFFENYRTGQPVSFTSDELTDLTSDFDFLMPPDRKGMMVHFKPTEQPPFPLRATFGKGPSAVIYEYILFKLSGTGTEESTFESVTSLPFSITLVLRKGGSGNVRFLDRSNGHDVQEVRRMTQAIITAIASGEVDFYHLSRGARFIRAVINGNAPAWLPLYTHFLDDASAVAADYGIVLTIPDTITANDHKSLILLRKLQSGFSTTVDPITVTWEKVAHTPKDTAIPVDGSLFIVQPEFPNEIIVFKKRIRTGPVRYDIPRGRVREAEEYRDFLLNAPIGSSGTFTVDPTAEVMIQREPHP